jgi:hypothetical protein
MAKQILNLGTAADDGTGTHGRSGGDIINDNFTELYNGKINADGSIDFTGTQSIQNLLPVTDATYHIGDATHALNYTQYDVYSGASITARNGYTGNRAYGSNSDVFWGLDNVFQGFYSQRTIAVDSSSLTNTADYTNLYQGDSTYPLIDINYFAGDGSIGYSLIAPNFLTSAAKVGEYNSSEADGGGGFAIHGRGTQRYVYMYYDTVKPSRFCITASSGTSKLSSDTNEIGLGGLNVAAIVPIKSNTISDSDSIDNNNAIDLGASANKWKDGIFAGDVSAATFTPVSVPDIQGSRGGNAALADLLTKLAALGLITDSTT